MWNIKKIIIIIHCKISIVLYKNVIISIEYSFIRFIGLLNQFILLKEYFNMKCYLAPYNLPEKSIKEIQYKPGENVYYRQLLPNQICIFTEFK